METGTLTILFTLALVVLLLSGLPVSFTMGGIAILGTLYVWGWKGLYMVAGTAFTEVTSYILLAVPLFLLMANILRYSGLADDLYEMIYKWMGWLPGGLAAGTVVICAIFAAMAGISSVATITMGLIALPSMLKRGYDKEMVVGCISAGGALGILIPPSIIMIIYGSMAEVSIGQLFIGGIMPGILLATMFVIYVLVRCFVNPKMGPPVEERFSMKEKLRSIKAVIMPGLLVVLVLGVIYSGAATPTEAAGIGALGAMVVALLHGRLSRKDFKAALLSTLSLNAMVMWIVIGAVSFTHVLSYAGVSRMIQDVILSLGLSKWFLYFCMQMIYFVLGCFLDPAGIIMLTTPVFVPLIKALGFDPVWFGVIFTINMEMAYITPPFGFNLFIMKAIVPPDISMSDIYRSIVPFVALQALCLVICTIFPEIVLYLPFKMITK
jgi:tripartite ATP-independent transporter DctM subunit